MAATPATAAPSPDASKNTFNTTLLDAAITPFRTRPSTRTPTSPPPSNLKTRDPSTTSSSSSTPPSPHSAFRPSSRTPTASPPSNLTTIDPSMTSSPSDDGDDDPSFFTIWGVSLLSSDERSDVVLLKFLHARDFKVADALHMRQSCAESLLTENLGFKEIEGVVAKMSGVDREGHPVCYNVYDVFKDKEMYEKVFGDDEKLKRFLRWRVQVLECEIQMLDLRPGVVNSIIQVTDLKDMPKRELRVVSNQILSLFQDNYPEMVARKIFVNVPWYFSVLYSVFSPFLAQRTKSKFVIAKEGHTTEILYKYIKPEDISVQYGGRRRPSDLQTAPSIPVTEFTVKGGEKFNIELKESGLS